MPRRSPSPRWQALRAGSLTASYAAGDLRYIGEGASELVRRVYFVARDRNWLNIPNRITNERVRVGNRSFAVAVEGTSNGRGVSICWQLTATGSTDGLITFSVRGHAGRNTETNRVGLCVHLPLAGFAGTRFRLQTSRGRPQSLRLPRDVAPHPPCTDIRSMRFFLPGARSLEIVLSGDEFELEDQRNWIDGSFKLYSRPLVRGYPYTLAAGETFSQTASFRLISRGRAAPLVRSSAGVEVTLGPAMSHAAPAIGLGLPRELSPLTAANAAPLAALRPAHLRIDLETFGSDLRRRVAAAALVARQVGAPLECALFLDDSVLHRINALCDALKHTCIRATHFLIFGPHGSCIRANGRLAASLRRLGRSFPRAVIAAGTDFNFAELNRGRSALPRTAAVSFAANPQVHASDEASIAECLEGLSHALESARRFFPKQAVSVSRLTLRPQKNAVATRPSPADDARRFDPRQSSAWCAAWTTGALGVLQRTGVATATLFETHGLGGLLDGRTHFPVFATLCDYLSCGDARPVALETSQPLHVTGWAREGRVALANLRGTSTRGHVREKGGTTLRRFELKPYERLTFDL